MLLMPAPFLKRSASEDWTNGDEDGDNDDAYDPA